MNADSVFELFFGLLIVMFMVCVLVIVWPVTLTCLAIYFLSGSKGENENESSEEA